MVTIFRTGDTLAMLGGFSHRLLLFLLCLPNSIVPGCIFPSFILDPQSYTLAEAVLFWKGFRILLTHCHCLISLTLCYLPVGV